MKQFTITVTKCGNCPYGDPEDETRTGSCSYLQEGYFTAYKLNKDGITPSCPMYSQSVEIAE